MDAREEQALDAAIRICQENGAKLVYLTLFGSDLYGTATGNSDLDARGIFLPSLHSIILGTAPKSLHFSTGKDQQRNCPDDMDIDLWPLQNWIMRLLPGGDTGALDLLFSPSNKKCVLYDTGLLAPVFNNPMKFLDLANNKAYAQYALSQARKYGIKGSRLGAIKAVWEWLQNHDTSGCLLEYIPEIVESCGQEKYCFPKDMMDGPALALCGKIHVGGIKMTEFRQRVQRDMDIYGSRAKAAEANEGVDYKALSHALRALAQMEELLLTGHIQFPLAEREKLIAVKKGEIPWNDLEGIILERLAEVERIYNNLSSRHVFDSAFAESYLLNCYGIGLPKSGGAAAGAVREQLASIEKEYKVKVLFAVESGSRAWGMPSQDSDFDIRFIYVHEPGWYLGARPEMQRDYIHKDWEATGIGLFDMSGWELRKALKLFGAGNPQLVGWLKSPIIYMEAGDLAMLLRDSLADCISIGGLWQNYLGQMREARTKIERGNYTSKELLYLIRPLLILLWLEKGRGIPPMELATLLQIIDPGIAAQIKNLVERKRFGLEKDKAPDNAELVQWLERECQRLETNSPTLSYARQQPDIDAIFRHCLYNAWPEKCVFQ